PEHVAGVRVEGDDAGALRAVLAADVRDHASVLDEGRAGGAEEALAHAKSLHRVDVPDLSAGREIDGGQLALGAERVHASAGDDGNGARTFVESEVVTVRGGIRIAPLAGAGLGVERFDDLLIH